MPTAHSNQIWVGEDSLDKLNIWANALTTFAREKHSLKHYAYKVSKFLLHFTQSYQVLQVILYKQTSGVNVASLTLYTMLMMACHCSEFDAISFESWQLSFTLFFV